MIDYQNHSKYYLSIRIIVIVINTRAYITRSCVMMYVLSAHDVVMPT